MARVAKAEKFEFTTFRQTDERELVFNYVVHFRDGTIEKYAEKLELPFALKSQDRTTQLLLQQVHLALGINYYKLHASSKVKVPYPIDAAAAEFWNKVYRYGLGEFAYINRLNPQKLGNFKPNATNLKERLISLKSFNFEGQYLTGIGGGKDSLVAWELLKRLGVNQKPFVLESPSHNNELRRDVVAVLETNSLILRRAPDKKLDRLRESGKVYRGHTPMSVIVAWLAILSAYVKKYDGFLVANESSSNEYNLTWRGIKVNHQWTKTVYFENAFNSYLQHIGVPIIYLSVVRPMNELTITSLFAHMPKYHGVFFSCNRSLLDKRGRPVKWCGHCAKCASASLLLAPFLSPKALTGVIGINMYNDEKNNQLFAELAGFSGDKPFECVCTKEEAAVILNHLADDPKYAATPVVKALKRYQESDITNSLDSLMKFRPRKAFPSNLGRRLKVEVKRILAEGV